LTEDYGKAIEFRIRDAITDEPLPETDIEIYCDQDREPHVDTANEEGLLRFMTNTTGEVGLKVSKAGYFDFSKLFYINNNLHQREMVVTIPLLQKSDEEKIRVMLSWSDKDLLELNLITGEGEVVNSKSHSTEHRDCYMEVDRLFTSVISIDPTIKSASSDSPEEINTYRVLVHLLEDGFGKENKEDSSFSPLMRTSPVVLIAYKDKMITTIIPPDVNVLGKYWEVGILFGDGTDLVEYNVLHSEDLESTEHIHTVHLLLAKLKEARGIKTFFGFDKRGLTKERDILMSVELFKKALVDAEVLTSDKDESLRYLIQSLVSHDGNISYEKVRARFEKYGPDQRVGGQKKTVLKSGTLERSLTYLGDGDERSGSLQ